MDIIAAFVQEVKNDNKYSLIVMCTVGIETPCLSLEYQKGSKRRPALEKQ